MERVVVHIGIGTNLGDRLAHIAHAVTRLDAMPETRLRRVAAAFETRPVGPVEQGLYLNTAAAIETGLAPSALLKCLQAIERERGRDRSGEARWGPRTLDLDILVYGDQIVHEPGLVIPHKRMHERAFVLRPLAQTAPELVVPGTGHTVSQLLDALPRRTDQPATDPRGSA